MQSSSVSSTTFKIVKKGYDPDEVRAYLKEVAGALQTAQDHAANVETRARQAVARAQEAAQQAQAQAAQASQAAAEPIRSTKLDDTETISRTLLLAQKTADDTVAGAQAEADAIRASARSEAEQAIGEARAQLEQASETARNEARRAGESERLKVETELQQLLARLEFLRDDVAQMEAHAAHHRERLLQVADELQTVATRPTAGLGESRRPVLSAAADLDRQEVTATQQVPATLAAPAGEQPVEPPSNGGGDGVAPGALERAEQLFPEPDADEPQLDITAEVPITE